MRIAIVLVALVAGCSEPAPAFVCSGHASCRDGDRAGFCEESGFCSFDDTSCLELRRYGNAADPVLADQCVDLGASPVGSFRDEDEIPVQRYSQATVTDGESIYVLGGIQGSTARDDVWTARVSPGNFGGIDPWVPGPTMPAATRSFGAAVFGGFVYAIGGRSGANGNSGDVIAAPTNGGALGDWTASSAMPGGLRCHAVVQSGNHVYVVGGKTNQTTGVADVVIGTMANGAIEWRPGPRMSTARFCGSAVIANGYLYAIGGCPVGNNGCPSVTDPFSALLASVEFAKIQEDGSLGAFQPTTPLPTERWHHTSAGNSHYIVVVGGHTAAGGNTPTVLVTHVNPDGSLGFWRESSALLRGSNRETAVVVGEEVFVISDTVQVASLRVAPLPP